MYKTGLIVLVAFLNISAFDGKNIAPLNENSLKDTGTVSSDNLKINYERNFYELGKYHSASGAYATVVSGIGIVVGIMGIIAADGWDTELMIPSSICLGASSVGLVFGILEIRLGVSLQNSFLTRRAMVTAGGNF